MDEDPVSYLRRYVRSVHILSLPLLFFSLPLSSFPFSSFLFLFSPSLNHSTCSYISYFSTFLPSFPSSNPLCYPSSIFSLLIPPYNLIILSSISFLFLFFDFLLCATWNSYFFLHNSITSVPAITDMYCTVQSFNRMYLYSLSSFIPATWFSLQTF